MMVTLFASNGSPGRTRTADQVVNSHPLYQLSYRGKYNKTLSEFSFHVNQIVRAGSVSENSFLTREAVTSNLASKQG